MTDARNDQEVPRYGELSPQREAPEAAPATPVLAEEVATEHAGAGDDAAELAAAPVLHESERVARGIALALLVVPVGVVAWTLLWNVGFIASIVSYGVAFAAVRLYRLGSRARVTRASFWAILAIIVVTVVLSLLAGIFTDAVRFVGIPLMQALTEPRFWNEYWSNVFTNPDLWSAYLPQILLALAFATLGCYRTIRTLAGESRR
ncbi:hypothetical protein [Leifsonia sp. NPDC058248]|uniref:hypothetical protein n=1 Tax=Leifsonia sp. NPDC058248 TaxID=3346402 RepID=UPI0036DCBED9